MGGNKLTSGLPLSIRKLCQLARSAFHSHSSSLRNEEASQVLLTSLPKEGIKAYGSSVPEVGQRCVNAKHAVKAKESTVNRFFFSR